jgi:S-ribosylhomocysteine lyase LuxS involved in autoinducer biosynthesis
MMLYTHAKGQFGAVLDELLILFVNTRTSAIHLINSVPPTGCHTRLYTTLCGQKSEYQVVD